MYLHCKTRRLGFFFPISKRNSCGFKSLESPSFPLCSIIRRDKISSLLNCKLRSSLEKVFEEEKAIEGRADNSEKKNKRGTKIEGTPSTTLLHFYLTDRQGTFINCYILS